MATVLPSHTTSAPTVPVSSVDRRATIAGRVVSGAVVLLLVVDAGGKLFRIEPVRDSFADLGIPFHLAPLIGAVLLGCLVLHLVPATSVLGAVLLTGYLGGATAVHLVSESPLWSHTMTPVYVGVLVWAGFLLRAPRARVILPGWR